MALTGIVNLADRLLSQSQSQAQTEQSAPDASAKVSPENSAPTKAPAAPSTDAFTSSTQSPAANASAQAAGLFSVNTLSLFTTAANFLLGSGNTAGSSPITTPAASATNATPVTTTNAASAATTATTPAGTQTASAVGGEGTNVIAIARESVPLAALLQNSNAAVQPVVTARATTNTAATSTATAPASTAAASTAAASAIPTITGSSADAPSAAATTTGTSAPANTSANTDGSDSVLAAVPPPLPSVAQAATTNNELQALNDLLAAEGLSSSQIAQVDNVAQALDNYNPTAYSSLVNQLEFAAQTRTSLAATASAQIVPTITNPSTAAVTGEAAAAVALPKVSSAAAGVSKV